MPRGRSILETAQRLPLLIAAAVWLCCSACDTAFEPFTTGTQYFTVLGFLDTDADTQFVRVVPLRRTIDRSRPTPIDAVVHTLDLDTGETVAWRDSLVRFPDSTYGHVFRAAFRPEPEHRYRLEVERSDGVRTQAETLVPPRPDTTQVYTALNRNAFFQPIIWPGVEQVIDVDVLYRVNIKPGGFIPPPDPPPSTATEVFIRYADDDRGTFREGAWRIDLQLVDDREVVTDRLADEGRFGPLVLLYSLTVRIAVPSAAWHPPGGVWDPDVLVQPGTISNVTNGLGFWESVTRTTIHWQLDGLAMNALNYAPYTPPYGVPAP